MNNYYRAFDIAAEAYDHQKSEGIIKHFKKMDGVKIEDLTIVSDENIFNKPKGRYILLEETVEPFFSIELEEALVSSLKKMVKKFKPKTKRILVVGLGNESYSPDSLGPEVIKRICVNNHYEDGRKSLVSAFTPGVMAQTGLESANMIKAIVKEANIDLVIAIDALATRKVHRLNHVIQLTDTGLAPGGGIGNNRLRVDKSHLDIPVIAIGVATVVDSISLVETALAKSAMDKKLKDEVLSEVYKANEKNLYLATKEIDLSVIEMAKVIANSINRVFKLDD